MVIIPKADPCLLFYVCCLEFGTDSHFLSSRQLDDPDELLLVFTRAIYLPLTQYTSSPFTSIIQIFYVLAVKVFIRVRDSALPRADDVRSCIKFFRYLDDQWHQVSMTFPVPVTRLLVQALALRVALDLGDVNQDIEEMADLCDELLSSDVSIRSVNNAIAELARAIAAHFQGHSEWKFHSEKVTGFLRKAILRLPELHEVSMFLARSLYDRFVIAPSDDDYQMAMVIFDAVLMFHGSEDEQSPEREEALKLAALLAFARYYTSGKPEHLEHAIYHHRVLLDGTSVEDPHRAVKMITLSRLEELRLDGKKNTRETLPILPESGKISSFGELIASLPGPMDVKPNPLEAILKPIYALKPSHINQLTDVADIEHGIKYCRLLLVSYPRGELDFAAQTSLGKLLYRAFILTHDIEYLNEAISSGRDGFNAADSLSSRILLVRELILCLMTRLKVLLHKEDLDELMRLFPIAASYDLSTPHGYLPISFRWASIARRFRHPSTSTAYDHAMSWMRTFLTFAPTLDKQHSRLVETRDLHKIPLDYTSYHIHTHHLEKAIETLEQGRGLLWSEMRGLRASIDRIHLADCNLADRFSMVNRELETLALTFSLNNNIDANNGLEGMDPYGHGVIRKQKLLDDRENLITQIRALPGFDTFLKPPSFDALRSAASHGPVIIINHSQWQSDILILLHSSPPSLIPTSDDFYIRANKLQDQLLGERKQGLESEAYEDALRAVLKELYELVGRPVIKRLNELNIPEQSRVWWCPTSVFCSLPLHAMGPIPLDVGPPRYFLDLYIPSYTSSLSALIDSHKPSSQIIKKPSILLVVQPDASMVQALDEMKAVQGANSRATTLIGATATPSVVLERLQDHRFIHIVCHGILEPGKPFDSSFKLHQGNRLSLLDIVQSQLPNAEFAFLAACHTAELTDESPVDEALHLAAAMQHCGFRSVVGTMWAMADVDGRDLALNFYKSVFSGGKQGVPYHERTAGALRDAVVRLRRRRRMTLERWVNYVHYGA